MQTRKEYAASLGLAKPGKGRMSKAAHEAIEKAIAEGMEFRDASPRPAAQKSASEPKPVKNDAVNNFAGTPAPSHSGDWFTQVNGKRVTISEKSVCTTCGYSLAYHACLSPSVVGPNSDIVTVWQ